MFKPLIRIIRDLFGKTETLLYPDETLSEDHVKRLRGPAFLAYPEKCIGCNACYDTCPLKAIKMMPYDINGEKRSVPVINIGMCSSCGLCVEVCPTGALDTSSLIAIVLDKPVYWIGPEQSEEIKKLKEKGVISWKPR